MGEGAFCMAGQRLSWLQNWGKPIDLTTGVPYKSMLRYGAPIVFSYLLQQIYELTDAVICGQVLTAGQVAGVNDIGVLTFIFLQFAFGCTAGFSVITAGHVGASDNRGIRQSFVAQMYLTGIISVLLTVISLTLLPQLLRMIHVTPDNPEVYEAAYAYCRIIFLGIIAQMGYNCLCSILRACGDSVTPLLFLIVSTLLNVGLDLLFLTVFRMGPAGAAGATVLTQLLSVIGCLVYTMLRYEWLRPRREDFRNGWRAITSHLKQGVPLGIQFSILAIGIVVLQGVVVRFDLTPSGAMVAATPAQNGFGSANRLMNFLIAFYQGLGSAILGFNAQNYGKKRYDRIRQGTLQALGLMLVLCVFCTAAGLLLSINGTYQSIFMSPEKITPASVTFGNWYLYINLGLYVILGFLIVVRSAVQGVFRPRFVLGAGIAELVGRVVICAFLPVWINGGPIDASASLASFGALCFGNAGAWFLASCVLAVPFFGNILRQKY